IDLAEKAPCRRVIGLIVDELFRDSEGAITHTPGRVRSPRFPKAASHLAIPRAMVTQVAEDTPAADAGLKEGDVLLQLEKKKISDPEDVFDASFYITAGDTVPITVMRGDQKMTFHVQATMHPVSKTVARFSRHNSRCRSDGARGRLRAFAVVYLKRKLFEPVARSAHRR